MAAKKGRPDDLNAPLRSLSERLRSLQRDAGEILETARREARRPRGKRERPTAEVEVEPAAASDNRLLRAAATLMERWDTPTRAEFDEIRERLDRIESALHEHEILETLTKSGTAQPHPSKGRRTRRKPRDS